MRMLPSTNSRELRSLSALCAKEAGSCIGPRQKTRISNSFSPVVGSAFKKNAFAGMRHQGHGTGFMPAIKLTRFFFRPQFRRKMHDHDSDSASQDAKSGFQCDADKPFQKAADARHSGQRFRPSFEDMMYGR